MKRVDLEEQFLAYLDGRLSQEKRAALEEQLKADSTLSLAFEEYKQVYSGMKKLGTLRFSAGPGFASEVMSRLETVKVVEVEKRLFMKKCLKVVGLLLLAVCILFAVRSGVGGGLGLLVLWTGVAALLTSLLKRFQLSAGLAAAALALFVVNQMFVMRPVQRSFSRIGSAIIRGGPGDLSDGVTAFRSTLNETRSISAGTANGPSLEDFAAQRTVDTAPGALLKLERHLGTFSEKQRGSAVEGLSSGIGGNDAAGPKSFSMADEAWEAPTRNSKLGHESEWGAPSEYPPVLYDRVSLSKYPAPYPQSHGQESYGQYAENQRTDVSSVPVSTFSIDVDTASYSNMRRFLRNGQLPPADSVRIEEYLNYFDYNYQHEGDKPFSVQYEIAPSPLDPGRYLLKLGIQGKKAYVDDRNGWNLVFLIDVSGSMVDANKLPLVKEALKVLVDGMRPVDRLAIVTYADGASVRLPSTSGADRDRIRAVIDSLSAGGSTYASAGIDLAYSAAMNSRIPGSVNRVILATDGDFNVGTYSFDGLMRLVEQKRQSGISLTTLGFGEANLKDLNLEQLADRGNGNYFYIDSFREARKIFQKELAATMETIAKDVKLQIEFNPSKVAEYRLIGYDNRKLENRDFNNDAVDAGEIGAGHKVTALYEITLAGSPLATNARRYERRYEEEAAASTADQKKEAPHGGEVAFLKIRYKEPEGARSALLEFPILASAAKASAAEASSDFRFAAAVAYFGQLLRQSTYAQGYGVDEVASLARGALGEDSSGARHEFVDLVEDSKALVSSPYRR